MANENTYYIETKFVFPGVFKIRAKNREEARKIAEDYCYWAFDCIRAFADDQVIDWEFPLAPKKISRSKVNMSDSIGEYFDMGAEEFLRLHPDPDITKTELKGQHRMGALPKHFPNCYLRVEQMVYSVARKLCTDYRGGSWDFWSLSNGGFFMSLPGNMRLCNPMNQSEEVLSGEAAGLVICVLAFAWFGDQYVGTSFEYIANMMYEQVSLLKDYADQHPEGGKIFRLID